jgi:hypothetical protein
MAKYSQKNYKIISDTFNCDEDDNTCKANMIKKEIQQMKNPDFQYFFSQKCGVPPEKILEIVPKNVQKPKICTNWNNYKIKGGDRTYVPPTAAIPEKPLVIKSTQPKIPEKPLVIKSTQPKIPENPQFVQSLPVQPSILQPVEEDENVEFDINFLKTIQLNTTNPSINKKFKKIQKKLNKLAKKIEQENISDIISFSVPISSVKSSSSSIQKQPIPFLSKSQEQEIKESPYTSISEKAGSPAKIPFDRVPSLADRFSPRPPSGSGAEGASEVSEESEESEAVSEVSEGESEASEAVSEVSEGESEASEAVSEESEGESEASADLIHQLNTQKNNLNIILKKIYTHPGSEVLINDITTVFDINNFDDKSTNHILYKIQNCIDLIKLYREKDAYLILPYTNYIHSLDKQKKLFEQNKLNIYKILENVQYTNSNIEKQSVAEAENELYHYLNIIYDELKRNNFFLNNEKVIEIEVLGEYKILKKINERIKKILVDLENRAVEYRDREAQQLDTQQYANLEAQQLDTRQPEPQSVKKSRRVSVENIEDIIQDISMEEDGDEIKKEILKCLNV